MVSMLFLGHLGELELAGGSLAMGFANITGYSVLSGLALGMEPICGQAFGAAGCGHHRKLLGLTLQRTVLLLLSASAPIAVLWLNMRRILAWCGQDERIASAAGTFITFSVPDLVFLSILHPVCIYLRAQSITLPLAYCSAASVALHLPINYLLVVRLRMGIAGVALSMVCTNLNLCLCLLCYYYYVLEEEEEDSSSSTWVAPAGADCLRGWSTLLRLAVPSCASVCLEWWWYEFMTMLCGLLANPKATVASMGILIQTTSLVYVFPSSLSLGAPPTAAFLACAGVMGLLAMAFTAAVRHRWGRLFTSDAEILELTAVALPIAGLGCVAEPDLGDDEGVPLGEAAGVRTTRERPLHSRSCRSCAVAQVWRTHWYWGRFVSGDGVPGSGGGITEGPVSLQRQNSSAGEMAESRTSAAAAASRCRRRAERRPRRP